MSEGGGWFGRVRQEARGCRGAWGSEKLRGLVESPWRGVSQCQVPFCPVAAVPRFPFGNNLRVLPSLFRESREVESSGLLLCCFCFGVVTSPPPPPAPPTPAHTCEKE